MRVLKIVTFALYAAIIVILGLATFLGQGRGAAYASQHVYHTLWFCLLWAALVVVGGLYMAGRKLYRQLPLCLLHFSFVVILAGAAVTFFFGEKGMIHLRQGQTTNTFIDDGRAVRRMPLTLTLRKFEVKMYPGTNAPSDFVSHISVGDGGQKEDAAISMNNIYKSHGYRFYQSSFDEDLKGTVLSVNHDPLGTGITYFGYALLAVSMLLTLLDRRQEFRRLLASPTLRRSAFLFALLAASLPAPARSIPTVNKEKAEQMARYQVVYNDRVVPLNTVATDFLEKVYGRRSYKGLSAEQVLVGWMLRPEAWKNERMIKIKNAALRERLGISGKYASMGELFDANGHYRLMPLIKDEQSASSLAKAERELDEKVGLILMLVNRSLFTPLRADAPHLGQSRIEAEIVYNRIPFTQILFMVNLTMGIVTFLLLIASATGRRWRALRRKCRLASSVVLYLSFAFALCGYVLRWYIGGRVPMGNGYETMLLLALMIMLVTLLLHRRFAFVLPFGFMLSGFALLVSHLGQMNPQITQLMPVLHSPLLSVHVGIIMAAYALLAFMALNGIFACILLKKRNKSEETVMQVKQLTTLSRLMLYPAVFFLAIGIFLGAVWANVSWGAYWSWDPKETWALITLMVYAVAFHHGSLPFLRNDLFFHLYLIFAFLTVLMTYFGVNFFMAGMHSYA